MGRKVGSSSSVKPSQFFKIITLPNLEHNELRIPSKFVDEHGNDLNDFVLLKVPSGVKWHVELKKLDGDIWLSNGWKKIVDNYFIRVGHLLVFKYKGDSKFDLIIFDMSATEIEYPLNTECIGKGKRVASNSKASFKEKIEEFEYVQVVKDSPVKQDIKPTQKIKRSLTEEHGEGTSEFVNGKIGAYEKAQAFKSKRHSFMLTLGPSSVSDRARLCIPATFARRYFEGLRSKGRCNITLRVSGGRTWSGTCNYCNEQSRVSWTSFAKGNSLKVGDVCVFEMLDHVNLCMNVHIFRAE